MARGGRSRRGRKIAWLDFGRQSLQRAGPFTYHSLFLSFSLALKDHQNDIVIFLSLSVITFLSSHVSSIHYTNYHWTL